MGDKISLGEDMLHIDIIDQSSDLDCQVEKRLNDMVAIPLYGLVENKVQGDGNYQEEYDGESEGNGRLEGNQLGIGGNKMFVTRTDQQAVEVWQGSTRGFWSFG
ncbi:hypothetical protein GOBAR_DD10676 [Gossypium barbadense]|nr:hypothetical protein GOBAR_DD10676 [Gossypium barbadense]